METFIDILTASLADSSFVKLSLEGYHGAEPELKSLHIRRILVKREEKLSFTYRYKTRDIVKNYVAAEALVLLRGFLADFARAHLCTTQEDLRLSKGQLARGKPTHPEGASLSHDHQKKRLITAGGGRHYLHALNITDAEGKVFKNAHDKFRQINKYIEVLDSHLRAFPKDKPVKVADMGSGKGYLTFALYDHLVSNLGLQAQVTGVEYRKDMVDLCNKIARESGFAGLDFVQGTIADYDSTGLDVLIALHACDTATDEALYQGISGSAELIVVAPCCHKQIRREMEAGQPDANLDFLLKHGTFFERQAEMVTDALRVMLLEYSGYATKAFEFISDAHTPKNVMIIAQKHAKNDQKEAIFSTFISRKKHFGIRQHALEKMLKL